MLSAAQKELGYELDSTEAVESKKRPVPGAEDPESKRSKMSVASKPLDELRGPFVLCIKLGNVRNDIEMKAWRRICFLVVRHFVS